MKIIVGLGNYGDKYAYTYHNMGFLSAECLADKLGFKFKTKECSSLVATGFINGEKVIIAKPLTYMNLSGTAVKQLLKKHKAQNSDLMIIFDDIDIPLGTIRYKESGSGGTHNGMRNIIYELDTKEFKRMRIGIGPVPENIPLASYVLGDVPKNDRAEVIASIEDACDKIISDFIKKQ